MRERQRVEELTFELGCEGEMAASNHNWEEGREGDEGITHQLQPPALRPCQPATDSQRGRSSARARSSVPKRRRYRRRWSGLCKRVGLRSVIRVRGRTKEGRRKRHTLRLTWLTWHSVYRRVWRRRLRVYKLGEKLSGREKGKKGKREKESEAELTLYASPPTRETSLSRNDPCDQSCEA